MKQLICEMCESTNFLKEDGMFVCQDCGMKYSVEEAKKMMVDVEGAPAKSAGSDKIANMLTLAQNAIDQTNNSEAEDYSNKILEIDSTNARAWLIKGQAVGWQSKLNNIRMSEMASCFEYALKYVSEEEKEEFKSIIKQNGEGVAKAFLSLTTGNFGKYPSNDNYNDIKKSIQAMLDLSISIIMMGVKWDRDGINKYFSTTINAAAVTGSNTADNSFGPEQSDKSKYAYTRWINESDACLSVLELALVSANSKKTIDNIVNNYKTISENVINSCSYKFEASGYWSGYVKDTELTLSAKNMRRKQITDFSDKGKKKYEELKKEAREKYWEKNSELKEKLEAEKAENEARIKEIKAEIKEIKNRIDPEILKLEKEKEVVLPDEELVMEQEKVIASLNSDLYNLGLFKFKEKKEIKNRIYNEEEPKLAKLRSDAKIKRDELNAEIDKKIDILRNEDAQQQEELTKCKKRIDEINNEFLKDR